MDFKSRFSSRKLVIGVALIATGVALELLSDRGLTAIMAGFLATMGTAHTDNKNVPIYPNIYYCSSLPQVTS